MSKIWKELTKDLRSWPNWNDQNPSNFKQCKMLKCINSPSYRRKTKMNFLLTQKSVQRNQFQKILEMEI